jgi:hypothetical protein
MRSPKHHELVTEHLLVAVYAAIVRFHLFNSCQQQQNFRPRRTFTTFNWIF